MVNKAFLLVGPERFLRDRALTRIQREHFGAEAGSALADLQSFDAERDAAGPALDFLRTAGFFGSARMAVVHNAERFDADDKERVLLFLKEPSPPGALVLISAEGSLKKDAFLKAAAEHATAVTCYAPFENELPAWIARRAADYEKSLDPRAAALLAERLGKDLSGLDSAIDKLSLYVHPRTQISAADVEALIGRSLEDDVYTLVDVVVERNAKRAFETVAGLLKDGVRAPEIVGALASQVERIDRLGRFKAAGLGESEIASRMGAHPFYMKKLFAQAHKMPLERTEKLLRSLLECDEAVKTGKLEETLALERMLLGVFPA